MTTTGKTLPAADRPLPATDKPAALQKTPIGEKTSGAADKTTPAMRQWREAKARHPDKILFFRMGDFYEMFHDDAVTASRLVGLTLTRRGKDGSAAPLAGIPHHQLDRYLKEFMDKGQSVVICDQLEDPKDAKGVVKRGITRVVTPGTVVDDNVLPAVANNYLAAIAAGTDGRLAAAFVDVSTGEFLVALPDAADLPGLFERFAPAETLVSAGALADAAGPIAKALSATAGGVTRRDGYHFDPYEGSTLLKRQYGVDTLAAFGLDGNPAALGAAGAVLSYLAENQAGNLTHIRPPRLIDDGVTLKIDRNTIRNLELVPARSSRTNETLLSVLDETLTGPGARLLRNWLLSPPARLTDVRFRQDAVAELLSAADRRRELRRLLERMADFERITARVASERATPRDLAALAASIRRLPEIADLAGGCGAELLRRAGAMDRLADVADLIEAVLVPDPPANFRDGGIIREGCDAAVDECRSLLNGGQDWLARFQDAEQKKTGIASLKVGFNKIFGFYIEITNAHRGKTPPAGYIRKQTLVNAERYVTAELKDHEEKFLTAGERLRGLEIDLFTRLRAEVGKDLRRIQAAADRTAELDVAASLAEVAAENGYVMPEVHDGLDTFIEQGRHPVVERLLPAGTFVDNDLRFDAAAQRVIIVTGPNMAGKSTFIRQAALIFIMAHMGSGVPAKAARIGLADRVFSRVGASDDLARGQSTFMVEMVETAEILHNATERSLVILDEVGRGTSTFDGVSLAWAITEYLHQIIKGRVLFATHYHELAELGHILDRAKNYNVAVKDWDGDVVFLRKIQPGSCDRSYGIHVGRLAGIPPPVLTRAGEILSGLEAQAAERDSKMVEGSRELLRAAAREVQLELFPSPKKLDDAARRLARDLADVDVNLLSPMDAHALLARLARAARGK